MSVTANLLVFTEDGKLREEFSGALRALSDPSVGMAPRLRVVGSRGELSEAIRATPPIWIFIEYPRDPRGMLAVARELSVEAPQAMLIAILRPEGFGDEFNESSVLIDGMRSGVKDFLRRPISTNDLRRILAAGRSDDAHGSRIARDAARVVSFISNKGGVGKSTLATNAAVSLALRHPERVLLIDASLQMGVAAALLDLQPTANLADVAKERDRLDATMVRQLAEVHPSGLHLLAAPADAVQAMEVDDLLMARLITLAKQSYEYIIIDTFPMFDRVVVAALDLSDRAYVVLENVVPTLLGGIRLLDVLGRIGFPPERQGLIVNRYQRVTGGLSMEDVATRLQRPIDFVFPFEKRVMVAANGGRPVAMATAMFSRFRKSLRGLTEEIEALGKKGSDAQLTGNRAGTNWSDGLENAS